MKKWIFISLLFVCFQKSGAQTNCDNFIEEATDQYNSGHYDDCIAILENGLKTCSLSKSKKEKAYVLLINSNIEKDSLPGIDKNFRLLLKNDPVFKIKEYSGIDDYKKYFNNYYVYPKLSIGIRPHFSKARVAVFNVFQVMPNIKNQSEFKATTPTNTNLFIEYRLLEKLAFFTDAGYFSLNYNRTLEDNYWQTYSEEKSSYWQLDLGSKYYFLKSQNKLNFYIMGGESNQYLYTSSLILNQTKMLPNYGNTDTPELNYIDGFDSKKLLNSYVASLFWGVGAIYRIGYIGVGLDIRSYISLNTLNNKSARFLKPSLIQDFNYIDSDTRLIKSDFSVVFTYLFYKVKRKKIVQN